MRADLPPFDAKLGDVRKGNRIYIAGSRGPRYAYRGERFGSYCIVDLPPRRGGKSIVRRSDSGVWLAMPKRSAESVA